MMRNASLRRMFLEEKIDLTEPRRIECHFWTWSQESAAQLGESLKRIGFEIIVQRSAAISDDPDRWNLEGAINQSIDVTMRREFVDEIVKLADSHGGLYDGWGTRI
jgi:regulator of RNase E activity RraB